MTSNSVAVTGGTDARSRIEYSPLAKGKTATTSRDSAPPGAPARSGIDPAALDQLEREIARDRRRVDHAGERSRRYSAIPSSAPFASYMKILRISPPRRITARPTWSRAGGAAGGTKPFDRQRGAGPSPNTAKRPGVLG